MYLIPWISVYLFWWYVLNYTWNCHNFEWLFSWSEYLDFEIKLELGEVYIEKYYAHAIKQAAYVVHLSNWPFGRHIIMAQDIFYLVWRAPQGRPQKDLLVAEILAKNVSICHLASKINCSHVSPPPLQLHSFFIYKGVCGVP